jgi:hypothetical protein
MATQFRGKAGIKAEGAIDRPREIRRRETASAYIEKKMSHRECEGIEENRRILAHQALIGR